MGFRIAEKFPNLTLKRVHFLYMGCIIFVVYLCFMLSKFTGLPTIPYFTKETTCEINVAIYANKSVVWCSASNRDGGVALPITDFEQLSRVHTRLNKNIIPSENFPLQQRISLLPKEEPWMDQVLMFYEKHFNSAEEAVPKFENRLKGQTDASANDVACRLKTTVPIHFIHSDDSPFHELGIGRYFPKDNFVPKGSSKTQFKTCAVVSSSGSLRDSQLGKEIDSHNAVLRFNAAPVVGFENDVGSKTTIRIVNNKIFRDETYFKSLEDINDSELIVSWREGPYNGNMNKWYKDSQSFFCGYAKWYYKHPETPVYVMRLESVWKLWDIIQEFSDNELSAFPPTSGFLGVHLMLHLCETVDVYGYIPLSSHEKYCYYYKDCCLFCGYNLFNNHPVSEEKKVTLMMSEEQSGSKIKISLQGYSKYQCGKAKNEKQN